MNRVKLFTILQIAAVFTKGETSMFLSQSFIIAKDLGSFQGLFFFFF